MSEYLSYVTVWWTRCAGLAALGGATTVSDSNRRSAATLRIRFTGADWPSRKALSR
jgi:hypothetical protein